jgi:RNA polymerase sigma-70 factor (family 1)
MKALHNNADAFHNNTDSELTEALRRGEKGAFEVLFLRYWRQAHRYVKGRVFSNEEAKEIVQEVFTDIWHNRGDRQIESFKTYLFTALRYRTIKHIRSLITHKKYWDHYAVFIPKSIDQTQLDIDYDLLADALEQGVERLPEKTKTVFKLNKLQGKSLPEISKALNLSEKAIQYHLTKSLKALRLHLKDYITPLVAIVFSGLV